MIIKIAKILVIAILHICASGGERGAPVGLTAHRPSTRLATGLLFYWFNIKHIRINPDENLSNRVLFILFIKFSFI